MTAVVKVCAGECALCEVPVAERSKARVYGRSLTAIAGWNPAGCCVLSDRGLCDGPIPRPEESCRLWCVFVCDLETSNNIPGLRWAVVPGGEMTLQSF